MVALGRDPTTKRTKQGGPIHCLPSKSRCLGTTADQLASVTATDASKPHRQAAPEIVPFAAQGVRNSTDRRSPHHAVPNSSHTSSSRNAVPWPVFGTSGGSHWGVHRLTVRRSPRPWGDAKLELIWAIGGVASARVRFASCPVGAQHDGLVQRPHRDPRVFAPLGMSKYATNPQGRAGARRSVTAAPGSA